MKEKERELESGADEAKREFDERQRNNYESLKTDEVLTLKESVNIDSMVGGVGAKRGPVAAAPVVAAAAAPVQTSGAPMPASYQMAAPLNEAELTALLMASPLYQKLEQIKKSMTNGAGASKGHKLAEGIIF